jgi:ribose transport system substrate-binding protein
MTSPSFKKLVAVLMVGGLAIAACGDDDEGSATTEPPTETTASAEAPATEPSSQEPTTEPSATEPSATEAPATTGSVTAPSSSDPPAEVEIPSGPADFAPKTMEEAQALVEQFSAPVTGVGVTEPTSKKPEAGKKVVFVECNLPPCKAFADGAEQAAALLGWEFTRITYEFTPEGQQSSMQQAVDLGPDVIMSSGQTPSFTLQARQQMQEEGIIYIDQSAVYEADATTAVGRVDEDPAPPTVLITPAGFVAFQNGALPASWAVTQTDGNVKALIVNVPDIPIVVPPAVAFKATFDNICPDTCTYVELDAAAGDIGTNIPSMVVSELQKNPDINYIYTTSGDFLLGVEAAVKAAGFDDIKIVDSTPSQDDLNSLNSGGMVEATTGLSNVVVGWRQVDAAVRYFNGDPIPSPVAFSADDHGPAAWMQTRIYTADNAPESNLWIAPENYEEIFREFWHLD